jgi:hypothetical protein
MAPAHLVAVEVGRRREQPRFERALAAERIDLGEHPAEGLLRQVLAVVGCMAEAAEEAAHPGIIAFEDPLAIGFDTDSRPQLCKGELELGLVVVPGDHEPVLRRHRPRSMGLRSDI